MLKRFSTAILLGCVALPDFPATAQGFKATTAEVDAFVLADKNKDGVLSRTEFRTFVQAMARAGQSTARQIRMFGAYRFAFGIADADKNGVLTPVELRSADNTHRSGKGAVAPLE